MEVTILAIVCPAIRCDWNLATWEEATITTVRQACLFTWLNPVSTYYCPIQTIQFQLLDAIECYASGTEGGEMGF